MFGSRQALGNVVDSWGTQLGVPETNISERIAGAPTTNTATNRTYASTSTEPLMSYANQSYGTPVMPTGSVLGSSTSSGGSAPDLSNPVKQTDYARSQGYDTWQQFSDAQNAVSNRENELRSTIGSGYDQLFQNYQNLIPSYEQQQSERLSSAGDIYNQIATGLGQTKQTAFDKLGLARQQVGQNVGNSVKDLQQNLLGVVRNTGMQLGAMGAGDTSAANIMAPYAYTKMAGQEYGKIQRQGNDQLFQIETQTRDTENQYNQMINDVEIEKQSKFDEIKQHYGTLIANIRERMANLPAEKAQAMAGVIEGALNEARSRLATAENYALQVQSDLQTWAQNRMAQLNDAKLQLSNSANFSPQDIVWQELQARNMTNSTPQSTAYWNPEMMKKRREEAGYGA